MPSIPPGARSEKLADYVRRCLPVVWREEKLKAADGVELSVCIASTASHGSIEPHERHVVILYFQGNGSSLPPRLPYLSDVLKALSKPPEAGIPSSVRYTTVALSYRGFWSSQGRPSQKGIEQDAAAALDWTIGTYGSKGEPVKIVLWGQSIGAGVATTAAARHSSSSGLRVPGLDITGLILETPFTSVKEMLTTLYPQRWLPYRYLWPFLWNWWDSKEALHTLGQSRARGNLRVLILQAGKDELVPTTHGMELEDICKHNGIGVQRKDIAGALHTEVMARAQGRRAVVSFLEKVGAS
ncbi:MAG: hypothetical protein M1830_007898 [Pleopsidium flavum]|nr:MAG: hypothetical protein M1830_007898 [Pleopsidium flavum]